MAIINTGSTAQTITVGIQNSNGGAVAQTSIVLPAQGHTSFVMPTQYTVTGGASGVAEFNSTGTISVVAIRFNPSGSFTTAPAFPESGAAILSTGGGGGTPAFTQLNMTLATNGVQAMALNIANGTNGVYTGTLTGKTSGATPTSFTAVWDSVTLSGVTLNFANFDSAKSNFGGAPFSTATLSVQLSVQFFLTGGFVTGNVNLVGGSTTISGSISGNGTPF